MQLNFDLTQQLLFCFSIVPILFVFGLFMVAYSLYTKSIKGSLKTTITRYKQSFSVEASPTDTFRAIMQFALQNKLRVDDSDEQQLRVVLSENMTLTSPGSLYLIRVHEINSRTEVEVGVESKLGKTSVGPINNGLLVYRLKNMTKRIKVSLSLPETTR